MAHVTDLGFTMEELGNAIASGDVRVQSHPEFPELRIYNYTEDVQFRNRWNKITLACRGLILDLHPDRFGEVVARPWEKFFNLGQMDNRIDSDAPVTVTDKMDGSLGILYRNPKGDWAIATRGSFASEQAIHATKMLHTKYAHMIEHFDLYAADITILFEIIYPDNRIVVNYDGMDDLVLLGGVQKDRGYYYSPNVVASMMLWTGPVTETWHFDSFTDAISMPERKGMEGIVIRSGNKMVKLKQADYVELHRIVTNLSPKTIWEMLSRGKTVADICVEIPDEFHKYVEDIGNTLTNQVSDILVGAQFAYADAWHASQVDGVVIRKRFANIAKQYEHGSLLFRLLDEKEILSSAWNLVKPRGDIKSLVSDNG